MYNFVLPFWNIPQVDDKTSIKDAVNELSRLTLTFDTMNLPVEKDEKWVSMLYDLSDDGVIRYDGKTIGLGNPLLFFDILAQNTAVVLVTADDIMQLKYRTKRAERLVLEFLARGSESWLGVKLVKDDVGSLDISSLDKIDILPIMLTMMVETREGKDCNGVDAVVIEPTDDKTVIHRIQLKYGAKRLEKDDMVDVLKQFQKSHEICEKLYARKFGEDRILIQYYLVTTRDCAPGDFKEACDSYKDMNITVKLCTKKELECVWPPILKQFDSKLFGKPE